MSLANQKATTEYQEAIQATEDLESPAVGFAKTSDYKGGLTNQVNAVIKQNNTLLYLATKQSQKLVELEEKFDKLKQEIHTIKEREVQPADLEDSISSLAKRLDSFSISGKLPVKRINGKIHVFEDPNKIFKEQFEKNQKMSSKGQSISTKVLTQTKTSTQEVRPCYRAMTRGRYQAARATRSIDDFHNHVRSCYTNQGYDTCKELTINLLVHNGHDWKTIQYQFIWDSNIECGHVLRDSPSPHCASQQYLDCLNEVRTLEEEPLNKAKRSNKPKRSKQRSWEKWSNIVLIEEIAATDWGDKFSDSEATLGKVTILDKKDDWDDDERGGGKILFLQEQFSQNQQD
ncbi:hypothetical protein Tco_0278116 [Tanacetum coccineum]